MPLRTPLVRFCFSLGLLIMAGSRATGQPGLGFMHRLESCDAKVVEACERAPVDGREHVHTFVVNGWDPLRLGNLNGMTGYVRGLGFAQTHFGPWWASRSVGRQIRALRQTDPDARIVLVGFSFGALTVRRLANDLEREGIAVDRLVYVGGDFIGNTARSRPSNVAKVVNIQGHGFIFSGYDLFFNGADIDNALNVRLDTRHFVLPSRAQTMETLVSELATLAQDAHTAIAARKVQESPAVESPAVESPAVESPAVGQPKKRPPEGSIPAVQPADPTSKTSDASDHSTVSRLIAVRVDGPSPLFGQPLISRPPSEATPGVPGSRTFSVGQMPGYPVP
jgi:pimeloyl-ACP methyl ester carboxylesterase